MALIPTKKYSEYPKAVVELTFFLIISSFFGLHQAIADVDKLRIQQPVSDYQKHLVVVNSQVDDLLIQGIGFVVDDFGRVVTLKHNIGSVEQYSCKAIRQADSVAVFFPCDNVLKESYWSKKPYTQERDKDLALLEPESDFKLKPHKCKKVTFADEHMLAKIYIGTEVWIPNYDFERKEFTLVSGYIYGRDWVPEVNDTVWRIEAGDIGVGNSGTPVFLAGTDIVIGCIQRATLAIAETTTTGIVRVRVKKTKSPYEAIRSSVIKHFLKSRALIEPKERFEVIQVSPTRVDPPDERERKIRFGGMLDLIQSSVLDVINRYSQFEEVLDTDVLFETSYEIESFSNKLKSEDFRIQDEKREQAISFYIKGLSMKASRSRGAIAAVEYFERALDEDPSFTDAMYQIALYHMSYTDDSETALRYLKQAIELDPLNGEVLRAMGMYYIHNPKADSAIHYLHRAQEVLGRNDPRLLFYLGVYYDPYCSIMKQLYEWQSTESSEQGRKPDFRLWDIKRKSLFRDIPNRSGRLKKALDFFERSRLSAPRYLRPLHAIVLDLANESLLSGHSSKSSLLKENELKGKLLKNLQDLCGLVEYGLVDPRFLSTIALGYAAIWDCEHAVEYVRMSMAELEKILPSDLYLYDLEKGLERSPIPREYQGDILRYRINLFDVIRECDRVVSICER